jgi:hypothetical protein
MSQRVNVIVTRFLCVAQRVYVIVTRINQFTPHVLFNNVPYLLNHSICIMCNMTRVSIHTTRHVILLIQKLHEYGMIYPVYYNTEASEKLIHYSFKFLQVMGPDSRLTSNKKWRIPVSEK